MNIGFFGDSYVDVNDLPPVAQNMLWSINLCKDLDANIVSSGMGGSNQYYAIRRWKDCVEQGVKVDLAIWTFTWDNRLYSDNRLWQLVLSLGAEKKSIADQGFELPDRFDDMREAVKLYYSFLYNEEESLFKLEQQIKWVLELPEQYPDTKFIFLPNTAISRQYANTYFKRGILFDFAFEDISALEGEILGVTPFIDGKFGHLTKQNHDKFKNIILDIVNNYQTYQNKKFNLDLNQFRINR